MGEYWVGKDNNPFLLFLLLPKLGASNGRLGSKYLKRYLEVRQEKPVIIQQFYNSTSTLGFIYVQKHWPRKKTNLVCCNHKVGRTPGKKQLLSHLPLVRKRYTRERKKELASCFESSFIVATALGSVAFLKSAQSKRKEYYDFWTGKASSLIWCPILIERKNKMKSLRSLLTSVTLFLLILLVSGLILSLINQQQQLPLVVMTPSLRSRWKRNRYDRYSSSDQDEKDETNSSKSNSDCFILYVFVSAFK